MLDKAVGRTDARIRPIVRYAALRIRRKHESDAERIGEPLAVDDKLILADLPDDGMQCAGRRRSGIGSGLRLGKRNVGLDLVRRHLRGLGDGVRLVDVASLVDRDDRAARKCRRKNKSQNHFFFSR